MQKSHVTSTWFTHSAAILQTGDGGKSWRRLAIPPSVICPGDCGPTHQRVGYGLQWISCQSDKSCRAGGDTFIGSHEGFSSAIIRSDTAGRTWTLVRSGFDANIGTCPTTRNLNAVACPRAGICYAVGVQGTIVARKT